MAQAKAGAKREDDTKIRFTRTFGSKCERVFRAFTAPAELKRWFGPVDEYDVPVAELDPRVGDRYRIELLAPSGNASGMADEYREIRLPERLASIWRWEHGENAGETRVTLEFRSRDQGTEVSSVTHERFPAADARELHPGG